jgi:hypothetical protein
VAVVGSHRCLALAYGAPEGPRRRRAWCWGCGALAISGATEHGGDGTHVHPCVTVGAAP